MIGWDKPNFRGKSALAAQKAAGVSRVLCGLRTTTRRPPRDGARVIREGRDVGVVTSGNFSPVLGVGIALALVEPAVSALGTELQLAVRDTVLDATVVQRPFTKR